VRNEYFCIITCYLVIFQVFLAKGNVPAENYTFFIDILLNTIRFV